MLLCHFNKTNKKMKYIMMSPFGSEGSTHDIRTLVAPVGTIRGA